VLPLLLLLLMLLVLRLLLLVLLLVLLLLLLLPLAMRQATTFAGALTPFVTPPVYCLIFSFKMSHRRFTVLFCFLFFVSTFQHCLGRECSPLGAALLPFML